MSAPRVFVDVACRPGELVDLKPDDARHLTRVLRMKEGEEIVVVGHGKPWRAALTQVKGDRARATIGAVHEQASPELPVAIAVLQAIPKGLKMDDVVEKVVELGATRIVPVRCTRSYGGDSTSKVERWRRIALAAAQQSQRLIVPEVDEPANFAEAIRKYAAATRVIVAYEQAEHGTLAPAVQVEQARPLSIAVGPEGSFTDEELQLARSAGCRFASLGSTVLRTETAAPAMLAAIAALRGWW